MIKEGTKTFLWLEAASGLHMRLRFAVNSTEALDLALAFRAFVFGFRAFGMELNIRLRGAENTEFIMLSQFPIFVL